MDDAKERYSKALDALGENRLLDAETAMRSILSAEPRFLEVYEGLAMTLMRQNKLDEAIQCMDELLRYDSKNIMAHSNLSVFYMKKGMKEKAEEEKAKATVLQFEAGGRGNSSS